jgi:hypothetical protein
MPNEVAHQVVSTKASAHHKDLRGRIVLRDAFKSSLKFAILHRSKGYWACHLIVDPSAIEANAAIALLWSGLHKLLDIVHLASTCEAVHHE